MRHPFYFKAYKRLKFFIKFMSHFISFHIEIFLVIFIGHRLNRNILYNFQSVSFQRSTFLGLFVVGFSFQLHSNLSEFAHRYKITLVSFETQGQVRHLPYPYLLPVVCRAFSCCKTNAASFTASYKITPLPSFSTQLTQHCATDCIQSQRKRA